MMKIYFKNYLLILCLLPFMAPFQWSGNELHYFSLAKIHYIGDNLFHNYAAFNNQLSKFLSDYIIGSVVEFVGFDYAWIFFRCFFIFLYSYALFQLSKAVKVDFLQASISVLIFVGLLGQTYFAGEWIFGGVEAKTFSYFFVILGISCLINGSVNKSIALIIVAVYFHFLVGFFWYFAAILYVLINIKFFKANINSLNVIKYSMIFVLPMLSILLYESLSGPAADLSGLNVSVDQIYSGLRHPHHTLPYAHGVGFYSAAGSLCFAFSLLFLFIKCIEVERRSVLAIWLLSLHIYLLIAFFVSYVDKDTQILGKLYLFRPASLLSLITLFYISYDFKVLIMEFNSKLVKILYSIVPIVLLVLLLFILGRKLYLNTGVGLFNALDQDSKIFVSAVSQLTNPDEIILFEEGGRSLNSENFEQLVDRPTLVNWKFVPVTSYEIAKWYRKYLSKLDAFNGSCNSLKELNVDYIVLHKPDLSINLESCTSLVYSHAGYTLFKVGFGK